MTWIKMRTNVLIHCYPQAITGRAVIAGKYSLCRVRAGTFSGGAVFFLRYSWSLPLKAQFAVCMALMATLLWAHGANTQAQAFALLHQHRCLQQRGAPAAGECVARTVQLASQMHGMEFGGQVADALRSNSFALNNHEGRAAARRNLP